MGQQQLLLLVLGIVIVGIAIVVGINAYSENSTKSNWDGLLQDALRIASDAQSWKGKPELFGGSPDDSKADSLDFTTDGGTTVVDFLDLGYAASKVDNLVCYNNLNGLFHVQNGGGGTVCAAGGLTIQGQNANYENEVVVYVCGTTEANVELDNANSVKGGANVSTGLGDNITAITC